MCGYDRVIVEPLSLIHIYNDPCTFLDMWYTGGGNNDAQYSNPDYDAQIDAAKATSDQAERCV